ncbi:PKD domain-containing protein [Candidatus Microgenomates bacterium]|nr:PKD domain-containing protein [Candidatus Microgenomates bacterium]
MRIFRKRNLIILVTLLVLFILPISLYAVFQQVNTEKEAQVTQQVAPAQSGCDQIDIVRGGITTDASLLKAGDTVSFTGYCFTTQGIMNKLRFALKTPSGAFSAVEYLAFADKSKNSEGKNYFKATYPNVKLEAAGKYSLQLWGYTNQTTLTQEAFTKNFTLASPGTSSVTPTPIPTAAVQNNPPVCQSLSAIPLTGPAPLTTSFTGTGRDSDGQVIAFEFTFGDSARQTINKDVGSNGSASTSHVYETGGNYTAALRVRDNSSNFSEASALCKVTVSVSAAASASGSANLLAQPTKTPTPTPTPVTLPQAGIEGPMIGFIFAGLLLLTFGLLLAF